jgi:hypothetical protein
MDIYMRKAFITIFLLLALFCSKGFSQPGLVTDFAEDIFTDTSNFDGVLSGTEDDVQKALDVLDDIGSGILANYLLNTTDTLTGTLTVTGGNIVFDNNRWFRSRCNVFHAIDCPDPPNTIFTVLYVDTADNVVWTNVHGAYFELTPDSVFNFEEAQNYAWAMASFNDASNTGAAVFRPHTEGVDRFIIKGADGVNIVSVDTTDGSEVVSLTSSLTVTDVINANGGITSDDVTDSAWGIQNQNLVDKTAAESISNTWTWSSGGILLNDGINLTLGTGSDVTIDYNTGGYNSDELTITHAGLSNFTGWLDIGYVDGATTTEQYRSITVNHDADNGGGLFIKKSGGNPFVAMTGFDLGTSRNVVFGGGNWGVRDANKILFWTTENYADGINSATARMRIWGTGNVVIGGADADHGEKFVVAGAGNNIWLRSDNQKFLLGTGKDSSIYFDGSDLIIDPDLITAGDKVLIGATGDDDLQAGNYFSGDGSQGITNTSSYWLCTASDCSTTCQVTIKDGLITGCP